MVLPFMGTYPITTDFGVVDPAYANYPGSAHPGVDFGMPTGTILFAAFSGLVTVIDRDPAIQVGRGKEVQITLGNLQVNTCHMSRISVQTGQFVTQGQLIGYSGNTGYSSGPHCHVELLVNGIYTDITKYLKEEHPMIPDTDVWYARFAKIVNQITGQTLSRDAFRASYVGHDPFNKVAELSDSQQAMDAVNGQQKALTDASNIAALRGDRMNDLGQALNVPNPDSPQGFSDMLTAITTLKAGTGDFEQITEPVFRKKG